MQQLIVGLILLVVGAFLTFLIVPRVRKTFAELKHGGPVQSSLRWEDLTLAGPTVLLVPGENRPQPSTPTGWDDLAHWQRAHGGIQLGWQSVRLTLRGHSERPILVTKIKPVVLERRSMSVGWFLAPELGGGQDVHLLVADLDSPASQALLAQDGKLVRQYAFSVSSTKAETFELAVFTTKHLIRWGIELECEVGGRYETVRIQDTRFELTGTSPFSRAFASGPGQSWVPAPWGEEFANDAARNWRAVEVVDRLP